MLADPTLRSVFYFGSNRTAERRHFEKTRMIKACSDKCVPILRAFFSLSTLQNIINFQDFASENISYKNEVIFPRILYIALSICFQDITQLVNA